MHNDAGPSSETSITVCIGREFKRADQNIVFLINSNHRFVLSFAYDL